MPQDYNVVLPASLTDNRVPGYLYGTGYRQLIRPGINSGANTFQSFIFTVNAVITPVVGLPYRWALFNPISGISTEYGFIYAAPVGAETATTAFGYQLANAFTLAGLTATFNTGTRVINLTSRVPGVNFSISLGSETAPMVTVGAVTNAVPITPIAPGDPVYCSNTAVSALRNLEVLKCDTGFTVAQTMRGVVLDPQIVNTLGVNTTTYALNTVPLSIVSVGIVYVLAPLGAVARDTVAIRRADGAFVPGATAASTVLPPQQALFLESCAPGGVVPLSLNFLG